MEFICEFGATSARFCQTESGAFVYADINAKLTDKMNQQIAELQTEYEHLAQIAHSAEKRN